MNAVALSRRWFSWVVGWWRKHCAPSRRPLVRSRRLALERLEDRNPPTSFNLAAPVELAPLPYLAEFNSPMRSALGEERRDTHADGWAAPKLLSLLPVPTRPKPDEAPLRTAAPPADPSLVFGSPDATRNIGALDDLFRNLQSSDPFGNPPPSAHAKTKPAQTNNNIPNAPAQSSGGGTPGGVSTPAVQSGGGGGGSGGGGNGAANQLNTLANEGAFAGPNLTATHATHAGHGAGAPAVPSVAFAAPAAAPHLAPVPPPHGPIIHRASGPRIGDPPISATEGVGWSGLVATIGDSDGDDGNGGPAETISGTIDWGDNSSQAFNLPMAEGGSNALNAGHTWMEKGNYTVTITATDPDGGQSGATETASVADGSLVWAGGTNAPNFPPNWSQTFEAAPSITTPASQTNAEGQAVSLQVQASDPTDGDGLTYDALGLPPGLSINPTSGLISGTVDYAAAEDFDGSYTPTIIVADGHGGSNQTSFAWTITDTPRPPVVTAPANQTNAAGQTASLQISATDPDGNTLSYDATGLPEGLSIDPDSGLISGAIDPTAGSPTPYSVTVTATDDSSNLSASQTFAWTVTTANLTPVLTSPGNQTNAAGDNVSLALFASDADNDNLTYTVTGLPAGLNIDPASGTISGILANSAASSTPYTITVTASDGVASSSQTFQWAVNYVGLPAPGAQSNLDGDVVSLPMTGVDAGGLTLTYNATNLPPGLSINSSSGLISGTISNSANNSTPYAVTITAADTANHSANQTFNWTVARLALTNPGTQENQEGSAVSLPLSVTDVGGTPSYSATGLPPGLSVNSSTGLISGTIGTAAHGSSPYQVTVTATDSGNTSNQSFVWTVTPRVALINPGSQTNATGDSVSLQLSATSPGGTMTYRATGLPAGLSIGNSSGLISGTIASNAASTTPYAVTVTANDGTSSSSQTFLWNVAVIAIAPLAAQTNLDGDVVSLALTTHYHGSGTLGYCATGLPTGLGINATTGQISGTVASTADSGSPYPVTVTATDGPNTTNQTFNWTINSRVSIASISDQSNGVGDTVSVPVSATDANNATLRYSATGLPLGVTIDTTGLISGMIANGADASSPYAVTVTVGDGTVNATQSFNWTVAHVSLTNPGPLTSVDGQAVSLQMQGHDADGDTISWSASGLPNGLSISNTGLISGTLATNADGSSAYDVTVTANDGNGNSTNQTFVWTVTQVGLSSPGNQTNTEGDNVSLQLQGLSNGGLLTYSASGLPAGLSINATGLISGAIAPGATANGPYTTTVAVSNGTNNSSQQFTWTVNPVVTLTSIANQSSVEGSSVSLPVSATDSKNASLTFTASGLPSGLSISNTSGLIAGTIATGDAANGPYAVTVMASDGTYSSSQTFTWTITHSDAATPTLTNPGTQVNVAGDSVNLAINASDPDGDPLTYSATNLPDGLSIDPFSGLISGVVANDAVSTTPYSITVTADDGNGKTVSQTFTEIINDAPLTAQGTAINAVEGNDTGTITVATFTTPDLNYGDDGEDDGSEFTVVVNWGDGNTDTGVVTGQNGNFTVTDDHTYAEKGTFPVSVTITDQNGTSVTASSTAMVADAALTLTGGFQLGDPRSNPQSSFTLASFTDANPNAPLSDYMVSIDWGDGNTSSGNYVQNTGNGVYLIVAPHSYSLPFPNVGPLTETVTVTLTDVDGASATTTSTVVVGILSAGVPATMGGWVFLDNNPYATAQDFIANGQTAVATINWGDGSSSLGTVGGGPGNGTGAVSFHVSGTHTYTQDSIEQPGGKYTITVTVADVDGSSLSGRQYVSVVRPPVAGSANELEGQPGVALNNVQVAEFTVPDATDGQGEFSANINWGDGNSNSGAIQEVAPGLFEVLGSHTYAADGPYVVQVEVSQGWNSVLPVILMTNVAMISQGDRTAKDTFVAEAKPNLAAAIRNEYVAQQGRIEVLKGWLTRFVAPASVIPDSVTWWAGTTKLGQGAVLNDYQENTVGLFRIVMKAKDKASGQMVEASRREAVGDVNASLKLTVGGDYIKDPKNPNAVLSPEDVDKKTRAVIYTGEVSLAKDSKDEKVELPKFEWGFMQSVTGTASGVLEVSKVVWKRGIPAGTTITVFKTITLAAKYNNTNDSLKEHQLYSDTISVKLGVTSRADDTPQIASRNTFTAKDDKTNKTDVADVTYSPVKPVAENVTFNLWEVVVNTETNQYVPVAEQQWALNFNAKDAGPWRVQLLAEPRFNNFDKLSSDDTTTNVLNSLKTSGSVQFTK